jgi:PAT family beta-lactamase induction signal transducer AmpG
MSLLSPGGDLSWLGLVGLAISFFASAQDTVFGAIKTEILSEYEQGTVSGTYILGYRIGMLTSGSGGVYLSSITNFCIIYLIFACIFVALVILLLILTIKLRKKEPIVVLENDLSETGYVGLSKVVRLIKDISSPIGSWSYVIITSVFLVLYRLPDNFISAMINPFLIHLKYDAVEIATIGKTFGIIAAIIGGFGASYIMRKINICKSLLIFGILHSLAHAGFMMHVYLGKNLWLLCLIIGFESITGGMSMAAYIAFIASLCKGKYRGTQYSFFSSMMGFSRSVFPTLSGYCVVNLGWSGFFGLMTLLTIPSLVISYKLIRIVSNKHND